MVSQLESSVIYGIDASFALASVFVQQLGGSHLNHNPIRCAAGQYLHQPSLDRTASCRSAHLRAEILPSLTPTTPGTLLEVCGLATVTLCMLMLLNIASGASSLVFEVALSHVGFESAEALCTCTTCPASACSVPPRLQLGGVVVHQDEYEQRGRQLPVMHQT